MDRSSPGKVLKNLQYVSHYVKKYGNFCPSYLSVWKISCPNIWHCEGSAKPLLFWKIFVNQRAVIVLTVEKIIVSYNSHVVSILSVQNASSGDNRNKSKPFQDNTNQLPVLVTSMGRNPSNTTVDEQIVVRVVYVTQLSIHIRSWSAKVSSSRNRSLNTSIYDNLGK